MYIDFYVVKGLAFIVFGTIIAVLHAIIGESSTKFREKLWGVMYKEEIRRFNNIGFLVLGLFFILLGILVILHVIQL